MINKRQFIINENRNNKPNQLKLDLNKRSVSAQEVKDSREIQNKGLDNEAVDQSVTARARCVCTDPTSDLGLYMIHPQFNYKYAWVLAVKKTK